MWWSWGPDLKINGDETAAWQPYCLLGHTHEKLSNKENRGREDGWNLLWLHRDPSLKHQISNAVIQHVCCVPDTEQISQLYSVISQDTYFGNLWLMEFSEWITENPRLWTIFSLRCGMIPNCSSPSAHLGPNPIQCSCANVHPLHPEVVGLSQRPSQGMGTFVPLYWGCIATALMVYSWIGLRLVSQCSFLWTFCFFCQALPSTQLLPWISGHIVWNLINKLQCRRCGEAYLAYLHTFHACSQHAFKPSLFMSLFLA